MDDREDVFLFLQLVKNAVRELSQLLIWQVLKLEGLIVLDDLIDVVLPILRDSFQVSIGAHEQDLAQIIFFALQLTLGSINDLLLHDRVGDLEEVSGHVGGEQLGDVVLVGEVDEVLDEGVEVSVRVDVLDAPEVLEDGFIPLLGDLVDGESQGEGFVLLVDLVKKNEPGVTWPLLFGGSENLVFMQNVSH